MCQPASDLSPVLSWIWSFMLFIYLFAFSKTSEQHFHMPVPFFSVCQDFSVWLLTGDHRRTSAVAGMAECELPCPQIQSLPEQLLDLGRLLIHRGLHPLYCLSFSYCLKTSVFLEKIELKKKRCSYIATSYFLMAFPKQKNQNSGSIYSKNAPGENTL